MIRNILKKTAVSLFSIFAAILFFSCTFIHENKSGRVSFSVSNIVQNSSRAAVTINSTDFLEVSLLGDYTATQTVGAKETSNIVFEEVPLDAKIYAEVYIYRINSLNKRYDKYSGKSESIIVQEGDNVLTVKLSAINQEENPQEEEKSVYTVKHLMQNIDDDDYTEDVDLRETLEGKASTSTNAKAKTITGFTSKAFEQQTIQSDDSTVVEIYYNRNVHTIKYIGGFDDVTDVPEAKQYRYGATIKIEGEPIREGYDFAGWITADADGNDTIYKTDELIKVEDTDIILTATWTNSSETTYKVIHYQQNIDDDEYTEFEVENKTGTTAGLTDAKEKTYEGFTITAAIAQQPIEADGSTVVKLYYDRNTYTVSYEAGADSVTGVPTEKIRYRYGATVKVNFTDSITRTGYTFTGWKDAAEGIIYTTDGTDTFVIGTNDITLYAQWTANTYTITYDLNNGSWVEGFTAATSYTYGERQNLPGADKVLRAGYGLTGWFTEDGTLLTEISADMTGDIKLIAQWLAGATNYTVRHWQQNTTDDEYTEVEADKQTLAGISDEDTNAKANSYEGFTAKDFTQQQIAADGSTVIDIYYDRNTYEVSFNTMGGNTVATQTVRYETKAYEPEEPLKNGNSFLGWYTSSDGGSNLSEDAFDFETQITTDITLYAKWSGAVVTVTVNAPDDESVEITCDSLTDQTAKELVFVIKNYVEGRNYKWYLDDKELTDSTPNFYIGGNSITMYNENFAPGVYVITLSSGAYSSSLVVEISGN